MIAFLKKYADTAISITMELILWQNNLNLNCVNLNYWQVLFNKTEYYMGFKIVLNLILILNLNFFYLNIEHLKFNTIVFFKAEFYRHVFSNNIFFALNS